MPEYMVKWATSGPFNTLQADRVSVNMAGAAIFERKTGRKTPAEPPFGEEKDEMEVVLVAAPDTWSWISKVEPTPTEGA